MAVVAAGLEGGQDSCDPCGLQELVQQGLKHELFDDGPGNLAVAARGAIIVLMLSLFDGLDAFVIVVDDAGPRSAGGGRQGAGLGAVAADKAAQQRRRRGEPRPARPRAARHQQGLNRLEGRRIDDDRNFVFDDFGLRLALAVALPIKLIEVPHAGVGAARQHLVNSPSPKQRSVARAIATCVQPLRDLLRSQWAAIAIPVLGQIECANHNLRFDRLDGEFLLLLVTDDLCINGFVAIGNDSAVGVAELCIGLHRSHCRTTCLLRLVFIHYADELPEHIASVIVRQRLGMRNQFNLVLA
ncbi:MAG: hypothetical protein BGP05_03925 [Rhizobiales bacterium 62-47]|nr:MAG: hypothetical protein BGP05_03925 [Rhizobiales bacterium 62-47]